MIKVIIFDLGGILVSEKGDQIKKEICKFLKISIEEFSTYFKSYSKKLTTGEISLLDFYDFLSDKFNLEKTPNQILQKHIELYIQYSTNRDENIISLINKLKENYKVIALTNTEIEIAEYNKKNGLYDYFKKVYCSTEVHLMKPQVDIFLKVLEELHCLPSETVFIDDKIEYVNASKKVGINSILFQNPEQLKKELNSFSILTN